MSRSIKPAPGSKRMNLNIEASLHDAFKAATAARGERMTDVLIAYISQYVREHPPGPAPAAPAKRGRK